MLFAGLSKPLTCPPPRSPAPAHLPRHLGIIMGGDGPAAGPPGSSALGAIRRMAEAAGRLGIPWLSLCLCARTQGGPFLDSLAARLRAEFRAFRRSGIRVLVSGDLDQAPAAAAAGLRHIVAESRRHAGLTLNLVLGQDGRSEILRGLRGLVADLLDDGASPAELRGALEGLDMEGFRSWLDAPDLPELDLLIHTGGERRSAGPLLWHSPGAEPYFSERPWPEWTDSDLLAALADFGRRRGQPAPRADFFP
jgi:undecaprenyl diphosphate synthase